MLKDETYYDVLGVTDKAPPEIVTAVYRAWMKVLKAHPDLGGDEDLAKRINLAYETLKNARKRAAYDAKLAKEGRLISAERGRRAPRTPVDCPIAYCLAPRSSWHTARALDASSLGLKLSTIEELVVGMHITIAFPGCTATAIEATVRWSRAEGKGGTKRYEAGVEFFMPVPDILRKIGTSTAA